MWWPRDPRVLYIFVFPLLLLSLIPLAFMNINSYPIDYVQKVLYARLYLAAGVLSLLLFISVVIIALMKHPTARLSIVLAAALALVWYFSLKSIPINL